MKRVVLSIIFAFTCIFINAQVPESFNYQAIVRNIAGQPLVTQEVVFLFSIIKTTTGGTVVYTEKHVVETNQFGLVTLAIGNGTDKTGDFTTIEWGADTYFLNVQIDKGDAIFMDMGTTQLLSVPYSLHSKTTQTADYNNLTNLPTLSITNWNDAYGWGNHAGLYKPISYVPTWSEITGKPAGNSIGDMQYWNGTAWIIVPAGQAGQFLQLSHSNIPIWSGAAYPTLTTTVASAIEQTIAISGGNVTSDGGVNITARGVCWSTSTNPTIELFTKTTDGTGSGNFTSNIVGLTVGTTYYVRAYATNSVGTSYGNEISFTTLASTSVTDIEGNNYNTITIGTQEWMTENLKTTKYNDGTNISLVTDNAAWAALTTPAYCWYNNDEVTYKITYGAMYNWYTVNTGNLCPTGWHVPNYADWTILTTYLGGDYVAGDKLREIGTTHWISPNTGATNESGFTALPGGERVFGTFYELGTYGFWWSSTFPWSRYIVSSGSFCDLISNYKENGLSVRCLKGTTPQSIVTTDATNILQTSATSGGNVTADGGATVTARGICWSTSPNPTPFDSYTLDVSSGTGAFVCNLTDLTANTLYYIRAFATNSVGTAYGNEVSFTTLSFTIGQSYRGGIIFYIDGAGKHGLLAAPSDQSTGTVWGCDGISIPGTSTAIGTGQANTSAIVNGCYTAGIAAQICNQFVLDYNYLWFLPSKDELNQMYLQKSIIGGLSGYYLSSSEFSSDYAWAQDFLDGSQSSASKSSTGKVRAVSAF